ncbi:MAG: ROK family protein [Butyrivibrio sp.]|jgi:predicted NBD/HSP70 family sugar kinase|nr:ROK family protein [Butyrivibrio sp.]
MNYICIDIGGTSIKYGVIDDLLHFSKTGSIATEAELGGIHVIHKAAAIACSLSAEDVISGVCVSSAGMIDSETGIVINANPALMPSYTGIRIAETISSACGLPCTAENDVNCAALAEYFHGAASGTDSSLTLTIGTGIGGAFIQHGALLKGHSCSACEVGYLHMEGTTFESLAATSILVKRVAAHYPENASSIDGLWIFDQAIHHQNQICIEEIHRMCHYLSAGISNLCYVLNPEIVVLGGGIARQKDYLEPLIMDSLARDLIPSILNSTRITFARNLNHAGMLGAYCNFRSRSSAI